MKSSRRYCLALDLKNDPNLIERYERHHREVWPEVSQGIRAAGVVELEIFRTGNRMFMILEVSDDFSFERQAEMDAENEAIQRWGRLMATFQQALPGTPSGEIKWVLMDRIFHLE